MLGGRPTTTTHRVPRSAAVLFGLVLAVVALVWVPSPAAAQGGQPSPGLDVGSPVEFAGSVLGETEGGAVHARVEGGDLRSEISGASVDVEFTWRRGYEVGPDGDRTVTRTTDRGTENRSFSDADVRVDPGPDPIQVVAYPENASPAVEGRGIGIASISPEAPDYLSRFGSSPSGEGAGSEPLGFWYRPSSSWLHAEALDEATVRGEFWLFVNNATVTIREDGREVWKNWTGYRTEQVGPTTRTYEERLLLIHLEGARLNLSTTDGIDLLGPRLDVDVTGTVSADQAKGRLEVADRIRLFENSPLELEGSGSLALEKPDATGPADPSLRLTLTEASQLVVRGGTPVAGGSEGTGPGGATAWIAAAALAAVAAGVAAERTGAVGALRSKWRSRRYTKWMTHGRELTSGRDYETAADCFRRAIRADPTKGIAWYHLGLAELEAGNPDDVLDVVDAARESPAIVDELDILELEATAAKLTGRHSRCRRALERLADRAEGMASSLVRDLELDREVLGPDLAARLGREDDGGELPGYV